MTINSWIFLEVVWYVYGNNQGFRQNDKVQMDLHYLLFQSAYRFSFLGRFVFYKYLGGSKRGFQVLREICPLIFSGCQVSKHTCYWCFSPAIHMNHKQIHWKTQHWYHATKFVCWLIQINRVHSKCRHINRNFSIHFLPFTLRETLLNYLANQASKFSNISFEENVIWINFP